MSSPPRGNKEAGVWGSGRRARAWQGEGARADTPQKATHHDLRALTARHGAHMWAQGAPWTLGALGHRSALSRDFQLLWSRGGAAVLGKEAQGLRRTETPRQGAECRCGVWAWGPRAPGAACVPGNVDRCGWHSGNAIRPAIEFIGQIKFGRLCDVLSIKCCNIHQPSRLFLIPLPITQPELPREQDMG